MEVSGIITKVLLIKIGESKTTGKAWKSQQYVLETRDNRARQIIFEVFGEDRIHDMNIQMGEELTVFFDIEAHDFQGRWYNQVKAWKVERAGSRTQDFLVPSDSPLQQTEPMAAPVFNDLPFDSNEELPF